MRAFKEFPCSFFLDGHTVGFCISKRNVIRVTTLELDFDDNFASRVAGIFVTRKIVCFVLWHSVSQA